LWMRSFEADEKVLQATVVSDGQATQR
jgi:hypothetical protein